MDTNQPRNLLLSSLSQLIIEDVLAVAELVHFDMREDVITPNMPIGFVDFIESGVLSLISVMADGSQIELALIGREGMAGLPLLLGVESVGQKLACQVDATVWRVKGQDFLELVKRHPELGEICQRYAVAMFEQVAITIGCNRSHPIDKRYVRWLLLTHDRCDSDNFTATQGFLASMLGVSRTAVNIAAGALLKSKLITSMWAFFVKSFWKTSRFLGIFVLFCTFFWPLSRRKAYTVRCRTGVGSRVSGS